MTERAVGVSWTWAVSALLVALTLLQYAPLVDEITSSVPSDLGDPLLNVWILWWNAHHMPFTTEYWNAPAFAPAPYAFALSETLVGITPLTTPLQWLGASPVTAYNAVFILLPILNGLSAYWLCLVLTKRRDAATIGALAFAFAPVRASQLAHLQNLATLWMPAALVGLHQFWTTRDRRWLLLLGGAVALNGMTSGYYLVYFSVLIAIAVAWLAVASWDREKVALVIVTLAAAAVALSPIALTYRHVRQLWDLRRDLPEIERFSADLLSAAIGSDRLWLWPIHAQPWHPEAAAYPQYPGIVLLLLLAAGAVTAFQARKPLVGFEPAAWRTRTVRVLAIVAAVFILTGLTAVVAGPWAIPLGPWRMTVSNPYKPIGLALNLTLVGILISPRFTRLVRSGSVVGLYATGAAMSMVLALGPLGRVLGLRIWYKPPFSWLMPLPGFDSVRVPALFVAITALCLAVIAALVIVRLLPHADRRALVLVTALAVALVADGWAKVPVVPLPIASPGGIQGELVMELPTRGTFEEAAAMYRGIAHGRRVVNGYSGFAPPHYSMLFYDVTHGCFDSLDAVRGGRSLDIVVWRDEPEAAAIDAALLARWGRERREEAGPAVLYRVPATATARRGPFDDPIDLRGFCTSARPR